jgi:hypothetical protein
MVKENETIEALHERAKIIVDMELLCACTPNPACVDNVNVRPDFGSAAPDCVPDPRGFWCMGPHKFGQYLHILTPAGSDDSHDGPQPWEGITGRVKQETNRLLGVIERRDTAMQSRVDAVEAKLQAQLGDVQSKLESIEALLVSLVAEKQ